MINKWHSKFNQIIHLSLLQHHHLIKKSTGFTCWLTPNFMIISHWFRSNRIHSFLVSKSATIQFYLATSLLVLGAPTLNRISNRWMITTGTFSLVILTSHGCLNWARNLIHWFFETRLYSLIIYVMEMIYSISLAEPSWTIYSSENN